MKVAVIGANGRLGRAFVRLLSSRHVVSRVTQQDLNLVDEEAVAHWAKATDAEWVINCAAISGLESCLDDPLLAHLVNARAPEIIAATCHRKRVAFLHVSTDYVLDGRHPGRKDEAARCKPINVYGESKLEGEFRVQDVSPSAWISRISWIFGPDLPSFPHQVLRRAFDGEVQEAIADKLSLPTFADDFVQAWERLAEMKIDGGIYNLCNEGEPVSWHEIGVEALKLATEMGAPLKTTEIHPTRLKNATFFRDKRPQHTAMSCGKTGELLGNNLRPWRDALREHFEELTKVNWELPKA